MTVEEVFGCKKMCCYHAAMPSSLPGVEEAVTLQVSLCSVAGLPLPLFVIGTISFFRALVVMALVFGGRIVRFVLVELLLLPLLLLSPVLPITCMGSTQHECHQIQAHVNSE